LQQLDLGKKVPPQGWKCEQCDLTTNLWLNLTDGSILCGRKFFDGSGGNDHAVEHFSTTSKCRINIHTFIMLYIF
jgi:ubiquitin carboxyl-terminal hydrolase 5/13